MAAPARPTLLERLGRVRETQAQIDNIAAKKVVSDKVLAEVARVAPRDEDALKKVKGWGKKKYIYSTAFVDAILDAIREYIEEEEAGAADDAAAGAARRAAASARGRRRGPRQRHGAGARRASCGGCGARRCMRRCRRWRKGRRQARRLV